MHLNSDFTALYTQKKTSGHRGHVSAFVANLKVAISIVFAIVLILMPQKHK